MVSHAKQKEMTALILDEIKLPEGFWPGRHKSVSVNFWRMCARMVDLGQIFAGISSARNIRYFDTRKRAEAWTAKEQARGSVAKLTALRKKSAARVIRARNARLRDAETPKPAPVKAPKPIKALVSTPKSALPSHVQLSAYKPKPKAAPAEIVHTASTRYSSRAFVDLRAVSVPFQRIGQAGFSMSIGGAT